jgi:hypothetical protein
VRVLARGILLHEYAKDLTRENTKAILEEIADGDFSTAVQLEHDYNT